MTQLQTGNRSLRSGDFVNAVQCYLRALDEAPALRLFIARNMLMARRGLVSHRASAGEPRVAVCSASLAPDADRALLLCRQHAPRAQVGVITWSAPGPGPGAEFEQSLRRSQHARHTLSVEGGEFVTQALELAAAQPYDVLHLVGSKAPNLILALLYKLLWGSRVLVDLEDQNAAAAAAKNSNRMDVPQALPSVRSLAGREWAPITTGLVGHFDALTAAGTTPGPSTSAAQAPQALTSAGTRLLGLLPLPGPLREILPTLTQEQPLAQGSVIAAPTPRAASPKPYRPPAPAAAPAATRSEAPAVTWTRCRDLRPSADVAVVDLLGTAISVLSPDLLTGIGADVAVVHAFTDLLGRAGTDTVRLRRLGGDSSPWRDSAPAAAERPFRRRFERSAIEVADLWFTNDAALRLRLQRLPPVADDSAPRVLRAFQLAAGGGPLHTVGEAALAAGGPWFVDLALVNPMFPLLLLVTTTRGEWLSTSLLPFPSLCRGGLHHGELAALGNVPDYMPNLEALSNSLLDELAGWPGGAEHLAVGHIEVDLLGAAGTEKLFSSVVKEWLAEVMQVGALRPLSGGDAGGPELRAQLESACAIALSAGAAKRARERLQARAEHGALTLTLSADALPTVSVLASRRLGTSTGAAGAIGSWVVADPFTGGARAVVSLPPLNEDLLALQPRGRPLGIPFLRRCVGAGADPVAGPETRAPMPLAIRFQEAAKSQTAAPPQPVTADQPGPLLRRALSDEERRGASVTLLLVHTDLDPAPLLASVAQQTLAAAVDVVVVVPRSHRAGTRAIEALLQRSLPGRSRILAAAGATPSACLNEAAAQARGKHLLVAGPGTQLNDPRALETLYAMALAPGVASSACTVLRERTFKKGSELRLYSGGMFPGHLSFRSRPTLIVEEPVTSTAFPQATYPVLGNSFRLALVSAATWSQLGGLDDANFPEHRADLDFCLRAARAGCTHLCTGVVTATDLSATVAMSHVDTHALGFMPLDHWHRVLAGASLVRDCEA